MLPDEIDKIMYMCTGSEANHGTSALTSGCSPAPDYYWHGGTPEEFTKWYAGEMQKAIDDLNSSGHKFSCFLAVPIFSSDGVYPGPVGFLKEAVDVVHKNGGVFIADEVQPGFARTGDAFWGFARHGIHPDMVTMGKPMVFQECDIAFFCTIGIKERTWMGFIGYIKKELDELNTNSFGDGEITYTISLR